MDYREALKWAAYYHTIALTASLVGLAIAGAGVYYGLVGTLAVLAGAGGAGLLDGGTWARALGAMNPLPALVAIPLGLLIRRIGRTTAELRAHSAAAAEGVDPEGATAIGDPTATTDPTPSTTDDGGDPVGLDTGGEGGFDGVELERPDDRESLDQSDDGDGGGDGYGDGDGDGNGEFDPFEPVDERG